MDLDNVLARVTNLRDRLANPNAAEVRAVEADLASLANDLLDSTVAEVEAEESEAELVAGLTTSVIWMSGASDFGEGEIAHQGWIDIRDGVLARALHREPPLDDVTSDMAPPPKGTAAEPEDSAAEKTPRHARHAAAEEADKPD